MRGERGVTLIELLFAITLVALISTGLLFAMRTSLLTYDKLNQRMADDRRAMRIEQMLERQIGGMIPIMGDCGGRVFFGGDPQTLRLISSYSLSEGSRGYPYLVEYQIDRDPNGGVRLMMNERLYGGPSTTAPLCAAGAFLPVKIDNQSVEAVGKLAYCRISYHEFVPDNRLIENWVPVWNRPTLPSAVRIEMAALDPAAARLPALTLNVPLRITRDLGTPYVDQP
jgi:prepilin-type N-terminal cleavage/methylation domain-containing protein